MKPPKVIERKLGKEKAFGMYYSDGIIEIDPRQKSKSYLNTLIHEHLHHLCPNRGEAWVKNSAGVLTRAIWDKGFRRLKD